jgi:hypothetical protein
MEQPILKPLDNEKENLLVSDFYQIMRPAKFQVSFINIFLYYRTLISKVKINMNAGNLLKLSNSLLLFSWMFIKGFSMLRIRLQ